VALQLINILRDAGLDLFLSWQMLFPGGGSDFRSPELRADSLRTGDDFTRSIEIGPRRLSADWSVDANTRVRSEIGRVRAATVFARIDWSTHACLLHEAGSNCNWTAGSKVSRRYVRGVIASLRHQPWASQPRIDAIFGGANLVTVVSDCRRLRI